MDAPWTELQRAWTRSDRLFGLVAAEDWAARGIPLRHPFVFYVGHLPAFAWNHLAALADEDPWDPELDRLFARGIDPEDARDTATLSPDRWPSLERVRRYRDGIREDLPALWDRAIERAAGDPLLRWVLPMILEHELMHHETLLYMIHRMDPDRLRRPGDWPAPEHGPAAPQERIEVGPGPVRLGADRDALDFGWDNEFPAQEVEVGAFAIDRRPVSCGEWAAFVEAGGYREDGFWTEADRAWRDAIGLAHPDGWRRAAGGWEVRSLFGWHPLEEVAGWPVHVSLAEARAWCRFRGDARLPTEAELHRAAFTAPDGPDRAHPWGEAAPAGEHGAFDFAVGAPVPVGSRPGGRSAWGVDELVGNGWEWTSTPFLPRPGFEAHLRSYPGYSADFFDGRHFVVFGASWATDRRLIRRSFRNWYQHHYPYVFATFRTVAA